MSKSSCVREIDTRFCKEALLSIPHVICRLVVHPGRQLCTSLPGCVSMEF